MNADTVAALEKRVMRTLTDAMANWGAPELSSVVLALLSAPEDSGVALEEVARLKPAKLLELVGPEEAQLVEEWRATRVNVLPFRMKATR